MRVRNDLVNRLKSFTDSGGKNGAAAKASGQTFNEEVHSRLARTGRTNAETGRKNKPFDPARDSRLSGNDRSMAANGHSHHINVKRYKKEISLTQAQRLAKYAPVIQDCAKRHGVPVELICGVILQESGGNPRAVSHAGAKGMMQLMPATAKRFGVTNSFDARQNIEGGTKYLRVLMDKFGGDYRLVLAGYNAGENNVTKYGNNIPPFAETRNYVPNVLGYAAAVWQILHNPQQVAANTLPTHAKKV